MAQIYPSLFSFYLLGTNNGRLRRKQHAAASSDNLRQSSGVHPAILIPSTRTAQADLDRPNQQGAHAVFGAQKQFLDLIEQLNLFSPCQATLKSILAYATGNTADNAAKAAVDQHKDNHYDPKGTLSVCN